ncbi:hypothetical protein RhiirA4_440315 [Rhizophagus irregularis]|uniref:Uncharacterized protein n=1 Tax=Rhizophagus irregularis TaxID=588596 RepID=A0A2I1FZS5_9GLOM|nr:hypothetical protein RhiirA4_440315 [Rhizophagus irregularis]
MSKTSKCSLRSITASVCDDVTNGTVLVTDRVKIPETNLDMNLVGKELCRRHYNKLIVNEKHRLMKAQRCAYPKHEDTKNSKRGRPRKNFLRKIPRRLLPILNLSPDSLICNPCLNNIDRDEEIQQSLNYRPPIRKISNSNTNPEYSYIFRNDLLYSLKEFKELETAYNEVCEELDLTKLTSIVSFSEKIHLMSNVLYKKQRKDEEKPIYDPDEFKKILEEEEPKLQGFFDELVASTNPEKKSPITNQTNRKKLVAMCHFLASINNKFINGVKTEVGFLLSASGTSASAIEILANAGLTIRRETNQRPEHQLARSHERTVKDYIIENCQCKVFQNTLSKAFDHFDDNVDEEDGEDLEDQDSGRFAGK